MFFMNTPPVPQIYITTILRKISIFLILQAGFLFVLPCHYWESFSSGLASSEAIPTAMGAVDFAERTSSSFLSHKFGGGIQWL